MDVVPARPFFHRRLRLGLQIRTVLEVTYVEFHPIVESHRAWDAKLLTGTLEHVTLADVTHVNEEGARALFNRLDKDRRGALALDTVVGALAKLRANEPRAPQKRSLLGAGSAAKPALDRFGGGPCAVAHRHLR